MSSPREAIYDVLKARHQRSVDQRLAQCQQEALDRIWGPYLAGNEAAQHAYAAKAR